MKIQINANSLNKILLICFVLFIAGYAFLQRRIPEKKQTREENDSASADTYIPAGHVLVPIQIDNADAVAGLIEQFAVVDLYAAKTQGPGYDLVATKVKLIRAPANPNQFAVLAADAEARHIMELKSSFWVVLQNRKTLAARTNGFALSDVHSRSAALPFDSTKKKNNVTKKTSFEYYTNKKH